MLIITRKQAQLLTYTNVKRALDIKIEIVPILNASSIGM